MQHTPLVLALFTIHSSLFTLPAAVPLRWTVETSRAQVAQFEAYRGETLDLEATMQSYGSPLATPARPGLYWQTNGMDSAWWTAPASASGNVLRATWSPTNDCGGKVYNCFIGGPDATYRAAFRLRMLPSPGYRPNTLQPPSTTLEELDPVFREWLATNNLSSSGFDTHAVNDLIAAATNPIPRIKESDWNEGWAESAEYANHAGSSDYAEIARCDEDYNDIQTTYARKSELDDLSSIVSVWQTYWDGDDVRDTVTNCYGSQGIPARYLEQKMPPDETHEKPWFRIVWDERTRWNAFMPRFDDLWNFVHQNLADRAWGLYDSSTGAYSPDGLLQLSQEQIMIASGMAWQKTVTAGGGSVWILTSTIPFVMSGTETNGFFRIEDGDGHALFEIVKGDKKIVPATATSSVFSDDGFIVGFSVDSAKIQHPVGEVALDVRGPYVPEDSLDGLSVTWNGESGYWVATVTATPPHAMPKKMFFRATYESGGNTYIRNHVATSIDKVVVGGIEYTVTVETVNGKKLLVLQ